jgi:hypothetical protein
MMHPLDCVFTLPDEDVLAWIAQRQGKIASEVPTGAREERELEALEKEAEVRGLATRECE